MDELEILKSRLSTLEYFVAALARANPHFDLLQGEHAKMAERMTAEGAPAGLFTLSEALTAVMPKNPGG